MQQRAQIIKARGASSAASAASRPLTTCATGRSVRPMATWPACPSRRRLLWHWRRGDLPYPCVCKNGDYQIVQGLPIDAFSRERMLATEQELREERASIEDLLKTK